MICHLKITPYNKLSLFYFQNTFWRNCRFVLSIVSFHFFIIIKYHDDPMNLYHEANNDNYYLYINPDHNNIDLYNIHNKIK